MLIPTRTPRAHTRSILFTLLLGACGAPAPLLAQPGSPGLVDHAVPIHSIDPANTDFADLQPLKALIGDARVVVLGEQSHQEGPVFLAKSRLIKFLHQEMGFDVLVFESGTINGMASGVALADPEIPLSQAASTGIFPVWGMSAQAAPAFQYVRDQAATDRPITLAGFDAQATSQEADVQILAQITKAYAAAGLEGLGEDILAAVRRLATFSSKRPSPEEFGELEPQLNALAARIKADRDALEGQNPQAALEMELARRSVADLAWFVRMMRFQVAGTMMTEGLETIRERDRRMGDNLVWLADEYYQGRKLIVWAATRHMVHRQKEIVYPAQPGMYDEMDSAGETVFAELGDEVYTIGFTAGGGEIGSVFREETTPIEAPVEGSVEQAAQMHAMRFGEPFLLIDFDGLAADHPLRQSQTMRPLGYAWQQAVWPDQMDAVFYIETMFKNDKAVVVPEGYELTVGD